MPSGRDQQLAQPRALAVGDELLVAQLGHPKLAAPRVPMVLREHRDKLLGEQLVQTQAVALNPLGDRQERQVERVVAQHLGQLLARLLADRQLDPGVALVEHRQRQRDVDRPHGVHRADVDAPALHPLEGRELGRRRFDFHEDSPRACDQQPAGVGDRHLAGGPFDERHPELLLEPLDLLRERRLCDVFSRRRAREMALVGERDQVPELPKIHKQRL